MTLELGNINIKDNSQKLISQVEIDVDSYGIYLISGKNGSGKTTLAKLLYEKYDQLIAIMLQENDLILKDMSVLNNIDMYQGKEVEIRNFLILHNLEYILEKNPKFLSGGERRLISILRILFSDKKILILDEPSNDIDFQMFQKIHELILLFSKEKAILLISHDDRFDQYVKKYEIQEKNIKLIEERKITTKFPDSIRNTELKAIQVKKHNFMFFCYFTVSLAILIYSLCTGYNIKKLKPYTKYNQNVYHLSSLIGTNVNEFNDTDAINTSVLRAAFKWNKLEYLKKVKENSMRLEIGLDINKETVECIYPLQFYNIENKSYINITDKMHEIISVTNKDNSIIKFRTSIADYLNNNSQNIAVLPVSLKKNNNLITKLKEYGYQIDYNNESEDIISLDFNIDLYNNALLEIQDQKNILVETMVRLKDNTSFMNFILENQLEKQSFLIQGYNIYILNNEINKINAWYILIKSLLIYLILLIAIFWITIYIYESSGYVRSKILYYYGFSISDIIKQKILYYHIRYFNYFMYIGCILTGSFMSYRFKSYTVLILCIIYLALFTISIKIIWKITLAKERNILNANRKFQITERHIYP